jgi:hypothetical protein
VNADAITANVVMPAFLSTASRTPLSAPRRVATATTGVAAVTLPVGLSCTTVFAAAAVVAGRLLG